MDLSGVCLFFYCFYDGVDDCFSCLDFVVFDFCEYIGLCGEGVVDCGDECIIVGDDGEFLGVDDFLWSVFFCDYVFQYLVGEFVGEGFCVDEFLQSCDVFC